MNTRSWHASYPHGFPFEAPIEAGLTLVTLMERSFAHYANHVAFSCEEVELTYRQLDEDSKAFAAFLQHRGYIQGDRVALMLPNCLCYPVALAGALRAGLSVVSINPFYTAREAQDQLNDSGALAIVTSTASLVLLDQLETTVRLRRIVWEDSASLIAGPLSNDTTTFAEALQEGRERSFHLCKIEPDHLAFLQYTGGTTGTAKGAKLTHANMAAGVTQMLTWLDGVYVPGECACVTPLPLYHVYPLNVALMVMARGGTTRLVPNPRDIDALVTEFKRAPFHILVGVNTLFNSLLASGKLEPADFSAARLVIGAGATIQQAVARRWTEATHVPICEGYGLTECSPCVTFNLLQGAEWTGSIGLPVPSTDVKLIDSSGAGVPAGYPGELCVKGPQVFSGYWNRPGDTANAFTDDGWFRTGDIARFDQGGFLYLVDRLKDMILVSGFNVYPNEIEAVVASMPAVLECACIGAPSERTGEEPHLFVVARNATLRTVDVIEYCRANLAAYKVPRQITKVGSLPKSAVGKILRRELRPLSAT